MSDNDQEIIEKREETTLREIQEELSRIAKLGASLNDTDKGFVKARRSYLTGDQKEFWKDVLSEKPAKKAKTSEGEDTGADADTGEGDTGDQTNELANLSYKELQARAAASGIKAVGVARPELEKLVAEAEANASE